MHVPLVLPVFTRTQHTWVDGGPTPCSHEATKKQSTPHPASIDASDKWAASLYTHNKQGSSAGHPRLSHGHAPLQLHLRATRPVRGALPPRPVPRSTPASGRRRVRRLGCGQETLVGNTLAFKDHGGEEPGASSSTSGGVHPTPAGATACCAPSPGRAQTRPPPPSPFAPVWQTSAATRCSRAWFAPCYAQHPFPGTMQQQLHASSLAGASRVSDSPARALRRPHRSCATLATLVRGQGALATGRLAPPTAQGVQLQTLRRPPRSEASPSVRTASMCTRRVRLGCHARVSG
eukprot:6895314-Prymnesium_polylepis.1